MCTFRKKKKIEFPYKYVVPKEIILIINNHILRKKNKEDHFNSLFSLAESPNKQSSGGLSVTTSVEADDRSFHSIQSVTKPQ